MFQVFKYPNVIVYVEGMTPLIAEALLKEYYSDKCNEYTGEYCTKEEIYNDYKNCFIDGYTQDSYNSFIKEKAGYVKLMTKIYERYQPNF